MMEENLYYYRHAYDKGTDQHVHLWSLIRAVSYARQTVLSQRVSIFERKVAYNILHVQYIQDEQAEKIAPRGKGDHCKKKPQNKIAINW